MSSPAGWAGLPAAGGPARPVDGSRACGANLITGNQAVEAILPQTARWTPLDRIRSGPRRCVVPSVRRNALGRPTPGAENNEGRRVCRRPSTESGPAGATDAGAEARMGGDGLLPVPRFAPPAGATDAGGTPRSCLAHVPAKCAPFAGKSMRHQRACSGDVPPRACATQGCRRWVRPDPAPKPRISYRRPISPAAGRCACLRSVPRSAPCARRRAPRPPCPRHRE